MTSFDQILENMTYPFDKNDEIHIRILDHYTTLFVGETLFAQKLTEPLNSILFELLQDIFSYYSTKDISNDFTSTIPFMNKLFDKSKEIWSKNFGLISQFHFEDWYKMLQKVMIDDLNNEENDSKTPNLKLYFYKYLCITPTK